MRERFHDALHYWGILMALYYGLLFLTVMLVPAEGAAIVMMVLLLFVQPIGTVACAVRHGLRCGFWAVFFLGAMFLMLPALFLFYGLKALAFVFFYGALAVTGDWIGDFVRRKRMGE